MEATKRLLIVSPFSSSMATVSICLNITGEKTCVIIDLFISALGFSMDRLGKGGREKIHGLGLDDLEREHWAGQDWWGSCWLFLEGLKIHSSFGV